MPAQTRSAGRFRQVRQSVCAGRGQHRIGVSEPHRAGAGGQRGVDARGVREQAGQRVVEAGPGVARPGQTTSPSPGRLGQFNVRNVPLLNRVSAGRATRVEAPVGGDPIQPNAQRGAPLEPCEAALNLGAHSGPRRVSSGRLRDRRRAGALEGEMFGGHERDCRWARLGSGLVRRLPQDVPWRRRPACWDGWIGLSNAWPAAAEAMLRSS